VKRIAILKNYNSRSDPLEVLLKKIFPECEICNPLVIDKEGKPAEYVSRPRSEKEDEKSSDGSSP